MRAGWRASAARVVARMGLAVMGLAVLDLGAPGTGGAWAQGAPGLAEGLAAPAQRPGAGLARSAPPPENGPGFAGADSAAAAADTLGQSATPATLPAGTFDVGNGISLLLNYTGQGAINPVGGIRQGSAWAGQLFFGLDADLKRLAGIDGASLHIAVTNRHGRSLSNDFIGNNTSVQEIYGGGQTTRLTLFSYQQKLFDDRLDIEVGRLVANIAFLNSPIYCNFQTNSACGNPTFVFKTSNFTFWPVSSWGGHAKAWLTDTVFFHIGAYEVNPLHQQPGDNGLDFSTKGATGAIVPFELGYSTTFANDPLPRNYGIGGWVDASNYNDPVRDITGRAAVLTGLTSLTRFGRSGVYARFDQMVWRPDPSGPQGLTLFGVAMAGTSGRLVEDYFLEIGALQTGTFAGRPYDTVGFVINTQKFSPLALSNIILAQASLGIVRPIPSQQVMMELNYGIQVTPAIRLTPNLQYIINPDQTRFPYRTRNIPDAFVVGAKLSVDLFTLAGLARGPGSL
jgi:porin